MTSTSIRTAIVIAIWLLVNPPGGALAREPPPAPERRSPPAAAGDTTGTPLSDLVREALERSPTLAAARAGARSREARISRAGAWEDPVLTLGFTNLRTTSFDFSDDFMTMKVVQLGQEIPLPGQIGHRRRAAARSAESASHLVDAARVEVVAEVKRAYADLYYRDRALEIVDRNLAVLRGLEEVTRTRYATGTGRQPAVLRAGLEIDGLEAERVALAESRRAALARLNALRDRQASTPVEATAFPPSLLARLPTSDRETGFPSALGPGEKRSGSSPVPRAVGGKEDAPGLPRVDSLVARALERKPELRAHVARIRGQEARVDHARAERWPAPRVGIGYGQREGREDMLNATLSFRLPIFAGAKQSAAVREEAEALARERSLHDRMVREVERDVTAAHADVSDALARLALYRSGILERARAHLEATIAAYRSGAEDFLALLDAQTTLYRHELDYHRCLSDLLAAWADLERAVGEEIGT